MKTEVLDNGIKYKKMFKDVFVDFESIENAYLRIEEVKSRMCCGSFNFDRSFLVLKVNSGNVAEHVIEFEKPEDVRKYLEIIKTNNQNAIIGKQNTK